MAQRELTRSLWFRSRAAQHTCSRSASATTAVRPAFPSYAGKAGYSHPTRTKPLLLMDLSSTCAGAYLSRIWNTAPTFPEPRSKPDSGTAGSRLWQPKTSCFRLRHNKAALTKARGHSRSRCDAVLSRLPATEKLQELLTGPAKADGKKRDQGCTCAEGARGAQERCGAEKDYTSHPPRAPCDAERSYQVPAAEQEYGINVCPRVLVLRGPRWGVSPHCWS